MCLPHPRFWGQGVKFQFFKLWEDEWKRCLVEGLSEAAPKGAMYADLGQDVHAEKVRVWFFVTGAEAGLATPMKRPSDPDPDDLST